MFEMEKAQRVSLTMQVEANLKSALIVGVLKPGARLVTKEIAGQLGTSVTPVREALLRLVAAGALDATPAQAFLVPDISLAQYQEITLIRKNLEGLAIAQASQKMDASKLKRLTALNAAFMKAKRAAPAYRTGYQPAWRALSKSPDPWPWPRSPEQWLIQKLKPEVISG